MVDWQCYGTATPSTELAYFLNSSIKFRPDLDRTLIRTYYEEFVRALAVGGQTCPHDYTLSKLEREVAVRNISLCTSTLSLLILDNPENRRKRESVNPKQAVLHRAMNQNLENLFERARWNVDNSFGRSWNKAE
jgi:hypothetical protein